MGEKIILIINVIKDLLITLKLCHCRILWFKSNYYVMYSNNKKKSMIHSAEAALFS